MRVGVVGINHKQAPVALRELLATSCHRWFQVHFRHAFVLLSTCNRTEIYFTSDDLAETHSYIINIIRGEISELFEQRLYSFFGIDCLLHLSRVAAGIDSAIVGESEIQGQVRAAYRQVVEKRKLPKELHFLFQKALKNGKLVRSTLQSVPGIPDLEHALLQMANDYFPYHLQEKQLLLMGASNINIKILSFLKNKGLNKITLCNRTAKKGEQIANKLDVDFLPWEKFDQWCNYDWIIFGTKSPRPLLFAKDVPLLNKRKLLIDLSVPRNVDPSLDNHSFLKLHNIDDVHQALNIRRKKIAHLLESAEGLIVSAVKRQIFHASKRHHYVEEQVLAFL